MQENWKNYGTWRWPIVIGAFDTVTKRLLKDLEDLEVSNRVRPSKQQLYWKRPEYWDESRRLEERYCHSKFSVKLSANAGVKNSLKSKIITRRVQILDKIICLSLRNNVHGKPYIWHFFSQCGKRERHNDPFRFAKATKIDEGTLNSNQ